MDEFTLCVDPGIRGCGLAIFDASGTLKTADYLPNPCKKGNDLEAVALMVRPFASLPVKWNIVRVIAEVPRVYPKAQQKGDPNDLIPLAGISYGVASLFEGIERIRYFPSEWKGNINADSMTERIKAKLSPPETNIFRLTCSAPRYLEHNVYDAVGMGLKYFGRLEPKRVISRG